MLSVSETILSLAANVANAKRFVCPEVARELSVLEWRKYMKVTRETAFELRDAGKVFIMQKGHEVVRKKVIVPIRIQIQ